MAEDENAIASLDHELIVVNLKINDNKEVMLTVQSEIKEKIDLVNSYETSFNRNHNTVERKQNQMDDRNKVLGALLEKHEVRAYYILEMWSYYILEMWSYYILESGLTSHDFIVWSCSTLLSTTPSNRSLSC